MIIWPIEYGEMMVCYFSALWLQETDSSHFLSLGTFPLRIQPPFPEEAQEPQWGSHMAENGDLPLPLQTTALLSSQLANQVGKPSWKWILLSHFTSSQLCPQTSDQRSAVFKPLTHRIHEHNIVLHHEVLGWFVTQR